MAVKEILLLGNPILRRRCKAVRDVRAKEVGAAIADLSDTLADFRARSGFGRGIAAPQISVTQQIVYINFEYTGALINPRITKRSRTKFRLWDDCFSFPDILVFLERNMSVEVAFLDERGTKRTLKARGGLAELLQHEIDHLNGVLAIDRAIDSKHIILRKEYERRSRTASVTM